VLHFQCARSSGRLRPTLSDDKIGAEPLSLRAAVASAPREQVNPRTKAVNSNEAIHLDPESRSKGKRFTCFA
jgi:hypothetical protein